MMTSSNGNVFRVTGPLWGNQPVTGGFPLTKASDVIFDLRLNKLTIEQTIETPVIWDAIAFIMMSL